MRHEMRFRLRSAFIWLTLTTFLVFWFAILLHGFVPGVFFAALACMGIPIWLLPIYHLQKTAVLRFVYFLICYIGWVGIAAYGEVLLLSFGYREIEESGQFAGASLIVVRLIAFVFGIPAIVIGALLYCAWVWMSNQRCPADCPQNELDE